MPLWAWVVLVAAVLWGLAGGLAFRLGHLRGMGRWYFQEVLPAPIRTAPLQLMPFGLFLGLLGVAAALGPTDQETPSPLGMAAFLAAWPAMIWWLVTMVRPAGFLKPGWLRDRETGSSVTEASGRTA